MSCTTEYVYRTLGDLHREFEAVLKASQSFTLFACICHREFNVAVNFPPPGLRRLIIQSSGIPHLVLTPFRARLALEPHQECRLL